MAWIKIVLGGGGARPNLDVAEQKEGDWCLKNVGHDWKIYIMPNKK